jgi:uncharacterized protein (DUF924 family)
MARSSQTSSKEAGMSVAPLAEELINTWFGTTPEEYDEASSRWFSSDPSFDLELKRRFASFVEPAAAGAFGDWERDALGALALILLLDQIPRNIFRDDPKSFAFDSSAREVCRRALVAGRDAMLDPDQRLFVYMPLMHSEQLVDHAEALRRFEHLAVVTRGTPYADMVENSLHFERKHVAVLYRFGRYPHRNAVLGRESTLEEERFLRDGRGF